MNDFDFIKESMRLALKAKGMTSPNPIVGCVIVRKDKIVADGWHKRAGGDHAEIDALKKAGEKACGAKLYVTLEPCFHVGRTPSCVDTVIKSGVSQVIIGMKDPNPLTNGKSIAKLRKAGIKVKVGVLQNECERMNEVFIKYITTKMPFVVAKSAQTLDGKIATATGDSKWITSDKTRQYARSLRDNFDAILVGINTVLKDNPSLSGVKKKNLKKVILDSTLRIPLNAKLFQNTRPVDCLIATTQNTAMENIHHLMKRGIDVIVCPGKDGHVDLKWLFKELAKREITSILIEGGAGTIGAALKEKLVDKMHIYIAPKLIGDQNGFSSVQGLNIKKIDQAVGLKDLEIETIGDDLLIKGYV